jgi:starch phosphorylase
VTDRLYGGGGDHRLMQELLLGIGGVRALRAYCRITGHPEPEVFHTNEGHAGFLGLERIRELTEARLSFEEAIEAVRAGTVFTTHTPVPAGIDRFPADMIAKQFGGANAWPTVDVDRILALGAEPDAVDGEKAIFNMAVMGMRLAQRVNGVSVLHGHVSREMFQGLWPGFDVDEVPIGSITNGVHAPTWVGREVMELAGKELPSLVDKAQGWESVQKLSDRDIWDIRGKLRGRLVEEARKRIKRSWRERGASEAELGWTDDVLDPDVLTIGFARRVPSYKRLTLMLKDPDRLRELLLDPHKPVQIVIAGKAHPADEGGKKLIQQIIKFADMEDVRHRIVFLPDYDMALGRLLVTGCDVWMNNPLRPLEACGTSGMKAALNGGLNLSIRDGWWDEWYDGNNGWAIPTADGVGDERRRDDLEAAALYDLIEKRVAPLFYRRNEAGLPEGWVDTVRHTLAYLGPRVQATRMVRDYVTGYYAPAAAASRVVNQDLTVAKGLAAWKDTVRAAWPTVRVLTVDTSGIGTEPALGNVMTVRAHCTLGGLDPADVTVQAVIGRVDGNEQLHEIELADMTLADTTGPDATPPDGAGSEPVHRYEAALALSRSGPVGYTVRIIPHHELLASPAELGLVTIA